MRWGFLEHDERSRVEARKAHAMGETQERLHGGDAVVEGGRLDRPRIGRDRF